MTKHHELGPTIAGPGERAEGQDQETYRLGGESRSVHIAK
jgi:hypothetical protein